MALVLGSCGAGCGDAQALIEFVCAARRCDELRPAANSGQLAWMGAMPWVSVDLELRAVLNELGRAQARWSWCWNTIALERARIRARELSAHGTLLACSGRNGRGALGESAWLLARTVRVPEAYLGLVLCCYEGRSAAMCERAPPSMREKPAGKCYFWILCELCGSGLRIAAAASVGESAPGCLSECGPADLGIEKLRAGRWARCADVPEANDAVLEWTCNYVSCDGVGCGALLCFLAARELRGRAYLRPMRSTDDDPAQASDNDDDDE
jgi:hypothetical protein